MYQIRLKESVNGSEFAFDYVNGPYCKCNKLSLNGGRSYKDSPKWQKNKKATIKP